MVNMRVDVRVADARVVEWALALVRATVEARVEGSPRW